jgi:hypothetical protein
LLLGCFEVGICYVAQAGFEFEILLPQPPKCWDYRTALHAWLSLRKFYCSAKFGNYCLIEFPRAGCLPVKDTVLMFVCSRTVKMENPAARDPWFYHYLYLRPRDIRVSSKF